MAIGDQNDTFTRFKALLPVRWFQVPTPIMDAVATGYAWATSFVYSLYAYAKLQTRILTATDGWLDMISADFFGPTLPRIGNQTDASFRARIVINMFRERGTRNAIIKVLTQLTGRAPIIFEPQRPLDTGAYGGTRIGYGVAGGYGSMLIPYQAFVKAFRPLASGIPYVAGYGISTAGYSVASQGDYASINQVTGAVADADIYAAVDSVKVGGTIVWTQINS